MVKTFIKIAIFLLANAYFVIQSSYVSEAALPPVCPVRDGYLANPRNCSQFVVCMNYNVTGVGACPRNLYFSQSRIACVPRYMANCSDVHHYRYRRDVSEAAAEDSEFNCVNKKNGFYSDLSKCGSYYECKEGVASSGDCVGNYEWSTELNRCDKPVNSDCTKRKQLLPNSTAGPSNLTDHSREIPSTTELPGDLPSTTGNDLESTTHVDEITDEPVTTTEPDEIGTTTPGPVESSTTGDIVDTTTSQDQRESTTKADDLEPTTDADDLAPVTTESPTEPPTTPNDEGDEIPTAPITEPEPTSTSLPAPEPTTTEQPTTDAPETEAPTTTEAATPPTTTELPTTTQDPICKGETDVQLPNPSDATCSSYYECDENAVSEKKLCSPRWLRFQPDWQACVPKFLVPCKRGQTNGNKERERRQRQREREEREREKKQQEQERERERRDQEEEAEREKKEKEKNSNRRDDHDHDHDHDRGYEWDWDSGRRFGRNYREHYGGHRNGYRYHRYYR